MLFALFALALAADPADFEPPPPLDTIAPVEPAARPSTPLVSVVPETKPGVVEEAIDDRALVAGVAAMGGAIGFGATAAAGIVLGTLATIVTGGIAFPAAIILTIAALPVGSGLGAGAAHALGSSGGAVSSGLAGAFGCIGGAVAGGGIGFGAGLALSAMATPGDMYSGALAGIIVGTLGAGIGGLAGAAIGPAIHAATE